MATIRMRGIAGIRPAVVEAREGLTSVNLLLLIH